MQKTLCGGGGSFVASRCALLFVFAAVPVVLARRALLSPRATFAGGSVLAWSAFCALGVFVVFMLFVVVMLFGEGGHGRGQHQHSCQNGYQKLLQCPASRLLLAGYLLLF
jgi:hypothetical protein